MPPDASNRTGDAAPLDVSLELYVSGDNPHSRRARVNLDTILDAFSAPIRLVVVDVQENPKAALARSVFATPSLIIALGQKKQLIVGDLGNHEAVLACLRDFARMLAAAGNRS